MFNKFLLMWNKSVCCLELRKNEDELVLGRNNLV